VTTNFVYKEQFTFNRKIYEEL